MFEWQESSRVTVGHIARVILDPERPMGVPLRVIERKDSPHDTSHDEFIGLDREGVAHRFERRQVHITHCGLTLQDWKAGQLVQRACNAGAIVHSFAELVAKLQVERMFLEPQDEKWLEQHPLFIVYLSQLDYLSGLGTRLIGKAIDQIDAYLRQEAAHA